MNGWIPLIKKRILLDIFQGKGGYFFRGITVYNDGRVDHEWEVGPYKNIPQGLKEFNEINGELPER